VDCGTVPTCTINVNYEIPNLKLYSNGKFNILSRLEMLVCYLKARVRSFILIKFFKCNKYFDYLLGANGDSYGSVYGYPLTACGKKYYVSALFVSL